jgi:anti-sigma regulatory factor (Ser/Thr protein kinase)
MEAKIYAFELKNDLSELKTLRRHLKKCAQVIGLSEECFFDINISLDELFTNIVSYGFEDDLEHSITFTLNMDIDKLVICVQDDGIPFNPLEVKEPEVPVDQCDFKIGGLGIFITRKLMDDICYKRESGKNKLTLTKFIQAGERPS